MKASRAFLHRILTMRDDYAKWDSAWRSSIRVEVRFTDRIKRESCFEYYSRNAAA